MKQFFLRIKAFLKSGISKMVSYGRKNKKAIFRLLGKLVIYVCKTIIELFLNGRF